MAFNNSFKLNKSNITNLDRLTKFTDKLNVKKLFFSFYHINCFLRENIKLIKIIIR